VRERCVGAFVKEARPLDDVLLLVLELGGHRHRIVGDGGERSFAVCSERNPLDSSGPMAEGKHLLACEDDPN
jgi:hypothetical protein